MSSQLSSLTQHQLGEIMEGYLTIPDLSTRPIKSLPPSPHQPQLSSKLPTLDSLVAKLVREEFGTAAILSNKLKTEVKKEN